MPKPATNFQCLFPVESSGFHTSKLQDDSSLDSLHLSVMFVHDKLTCASKKSMNRVFQRAQSNELHGFISKNKDSAMSFELGAAH